MLNLPVETILRCALADLEGILPEFDPEHVHPGWQTLDDLKELVGSEARLQAASRYDPSTQIALIWSVDDVLEMREDLTEEQAVKVLKMVDRHHDASIGVNWETLECWASELFGAAAPEQK